MRGKPPIPTGDEESYRVVFTTADPSELVESGLGAGRIIGPGTLPGPCGV